jgi:predicted RNase H-like nuclease (RuvC/YqgF family)
MAAYLKRRVFTPAVLDGYVQEVRQQLEQHLATPAADVANTEAELRRLEQEKARLIKLAATTDDDADIAQEINDRRRRIAQLQTQLAAARQTPKLLREKLDAPEARMRARLDEMAGLLMATAGTPRSTA